MIIKNVNLETVCGITSRLPENELPEIAFAGKSNVGKSSLINGLLNRKALARTSAQPGKTQTINFYNVDVYKRQALACSSDGNSTSASHRPSKGAANTSSSIVRPPGSGIRYRFLEIILPVSYTHLYILADRLVFYRMAADFSLLQWNQWFMASDCAAVFFTGNL